MYTHVNMMSGGHSYVTTRNGHGQSGWSPIGCAAYDFSFQLILSVTHTYILYRLVVSTPLKNMKVSWDYYSQ